MTESPPGCLEIINISPESKQLEANIQYSSSTSKSAFEKILQPLNEFNQAICEKQKSLKASVKKSSTHIDNAFHHTSSFMVHMYSVSDTLARFYQKTRMVYMKRLIIIASIALLLWELYGGLTNNNQLKLWILTGFLGCYTFASFTYYLIIKRSRVDNHFLDARSIAEALRVQMVWNLIGSPLIASDWFLKRQCEDTQWVQFGLRSIKAVSTRLTPMETQQCLENAHQQWLRKQKLYFNNYAIPRNQERINILEKAIQYLLISGVGLIALQIAGLQGYFISAKLLNWLVPLTALVPTTAGLISAYLEMEANRDHLNQFVSMNRFYIKGDALLKPLLKRNKHNTPEENLKARQIIEELGKEALSENGEWLTLRRVRPLQLFS